MYNLTEKQKEVIHKALITASDNGTLDEFTNEELKLINRAETIVNKLLMPDVSNQKKLLKAFQEFYQSGNMDDERTFDWNINRFLKAFNCRNN